MGLFRRGDILYDITMEEQRKIKFERPESGDMGAVVKSGKAKIAGIATDKKENKNRREGNPKLILIVLVLMMGLTLVAWWSRSGAGVLRGLLSPKTLVWDSGGNKSFGRIIDWMEIKKEIEDVIVSSRGDYAIYIYDLESSGEMGIGEKRQMVAASLIKLPVLVAAYQSAGDGILNLNSKYTLVDGDKAGGSGSIVYAPSGTEYTYRKLMELMGQQSDNTGFNVIVKAVGRSKVKDVIGEIGMRDTSFDENLTTAYDVGLLLRRLYKGELINKASIDEMFKFLTKTIFEDRIPAGVPEGIRVAHKVGTEVGVVSDAGVIFAKHPYILVVMSEGVSLSEAREILPKISKIVWGRLGNDN